ncbi:MAG: hypothetical protein IAE82_13525 [Opitutaceae bacterium]|nr:hypothetical protein [Opitutaceae bacterium]
MTAAPHIEAPSREPAAPARERRNRRRARLRWGAGVLVALGFHVALVGLTRVDIQARRRADPLNPRIAWVGDKAVLEEDTLRGQLLSVGNDTPLFMITGQNFAGVQRRGEEARGPGEIFSRYEPILTVPVDRSPPGLVAAPTDRFDPVSAIQRFQWPYFARFGRADPVARTFEARRARIEVRSSGSGALVYAISLPQVVDRETPEVWPDWRPFELHLAVSGTGRLSEPVVIGSGSGSDRVDQFVRDYIRREMRLDLRLGEGSYRIVVGP